MEEPVTLVQIEHEIDKFETLLLKHVKDYRNSDSKLFEKNNRILLKANLELIVNSFERVVNVAPKRQDEIETKLELIFGNAMSEIDRIEAIKIMVGYNSTYMEKSLIDKLNHLQKISNVIVEDGDITHLELEPCYIDILPDLVLINILQHLVHIRDVKALFLSLIDKDRIEYECMIQVRRWWELSNKDPSHIKSCEGPVYCHFPSVCSRCVLNGKGTCRICAAKTDLPFEDIFDTTTTCKAPVLTTRGITNCSNVVHCDNCQAKFPKDQYIPIKADVVCICRGIQPKIGCERCMTQCPDCSNNGCKTHMILCNSTFPVCNDCGLKHCCGVRNQIWSESVLLDYCDCPVYEDKNGNLIDKNDVKLLVDHKRIRISRKRSCSSLLSAVINFLS